MKKIFAFLIATVMLGFGSASAADTYTTIYSRALTGDSAWVSTTDIAAWGGNSLLSVNSTRGLSFYSKKPSASYSASKNFTITANAKVKYEVDWYTGNSTGKATAFEYIQFGDKLRFSFNSSYKFYLNTDGTSTATTLALASVTTPKTYKIIVVFNTATNKVDSLMFAGENLLSKVKDITFSGNYNSVTFGFLRNGSTSNWYYPNGLVDIDVAECKQQVTSASYVINYKNGSDVVNSVSGTASIGGTISANRVVTTDDNVKYLVDDATLPSMVITSGTNILNVNVHKPATATLNLTSVVAGVSSVTTTTFTETDDLVREWSCGYPMYKKGSDGVYYKADVTTYGESGTFIDGQVIEKSVSYSTANPDMIFFADASDAGTNYLQIKASTGYSNAESGAITAQNARDRGLAVGTISAGSYEFVSNITASDSRSLVLRNGTDDPFASIDQARSDATGIKTVSFELTEDATNVFMNGANSGDAKTNQSETFDYAYIIKVEKEETTYARATTDGKYGTICLPRSFTAEGAVIYKATLNDNNDGISLQEVATAEAGKPYIYQATAGDQTFTYVNGSSVASAPIPNGVLYGTFSDTTAPVGSYVLQTVSGKQQFGYVESGVNVTVPSNRAYAKFTVYGLAKSISLFKAGEEDATGINNVNALNSILSGDAKIYDLSGRQLKSLQKGINVVNGVKVIVK